MHPTHDPFRPSGGGTSPTTPLSLGLYKFRNYPFVPPTYLKLKFRRETKRYSPPDLKRNVTGYGKKTVLVEHRKSSLLRFGVPTRPCPILRPPPGLWPPPQHPPDLSRSSEPSPNLGRSHVPPPTPPSPSGDVPRRIYGNELLSTRNRLPSSLPTYLLQTQVDL